MANHPVRARDEIAQLVGLAEAEPIRGDYPKVARQRRDVEFPAQFGTSSELSGVQQDDCGAVPGIEVVRPDAADVDEPAANRFALPTLVHAHDPRPES